MSPDSLHEKDLPVVAVAPDGETVAVHSREGRSDVIAVIRISDGSLVRWVRGARAAAWSADGRHFALGGAVGRAAGRDEERPGLTRGGRAAGAVAARAAGFRGWPIREPAPAGSVHR